MRFQLKPQKESQIMDSQIILMSGSTYFGGAEKDNHCLFSFISGVPEHYSTQSNGSFPVFQRGFSCQVHKLLWTDQLVIKLQEYKKKKTCLKCKYTERKHTHTHNIQ